MAKPVFIIRTDLINMRVGASFICASAISKINARLRIFKNCGLLLTKSLNKLIINILNPLSIIYRYRGGYILLLN